MNSGPLIILSGPSGCGKSTVVSRLLEAEGPRIRLAISATTRPPRDGERDGQHYYFWTPEQFKQKVAADGFLEWAEVYGNFYGTPRAEVDSYRAKGIGVLLEIDVQGAEQIRQQCPEAVSIFLRAPSREEYENRLRARGKDSEEVIQARLAGAEREEAQAGAFDHQVINDKLEQAVADLQAIVQQSFNRSENA